MKIEYYEGCTVSGVFIDDKPLAHFTIEELRSIIKNMVDSVDEIYPFYEFFSELAQSQGTSENLGTCEQCGDIIDKYTYICK